MDYRKGHTGMKIYLTEVLKDNKMLVGPYIKAQDIEEAIEIADMYALVIVGELYELKHELPPKQETIH
tara:strand:- start:54 stop:257 length:204 start_codon:yes stop_codon:yes gene_type:complete